jgi:copper chaperone CopZ
MTTAEQQQKLLMGSAVGVAALSSICCWLPLLAVGLGVSAIGVGSIFEAYRWLFVGLAVVSIAGTFMLMRRRTADCSEGTCASPTGARTRPWLIGMVLLTVAFVAFPELLAWTMAGGDAEQRNAATVGEQSLVRVYEVEGMTCEGCTNLVVSYLEDQDEVKMATVSFARREARVVFGKGITAVQADALMTRVSHAWDGTYTFEPKGENS